MSFMPCILILLQTFMFYVKFIRNKQYTSSVLYMFHEIVLYSQVYFQQTAQYLALMLLHVSFTICNHLQRDAVFDDICSILCGLSVVDGKLYIHVSAIPQLTVFYSTFIHGEYTEYLKLEYLLHSKLKKHLPLQVVWIQHFT
jgi:hypothetical protein